jgi:polysaccharide biosynthesis/export protein
MATTNRTGNRSRQRLRFAAVAFAGLVSPLALQAQAPGAAQSSAAAQNGQLAPMSLTGSSMAPPVISLGDTLDVQVFGVPELSGKVRVDQFGNLLLPLGGPIHVAGLSAAQASELITERLKSDRFIKQPLVTVFVNEYTTQNVLLLGEVKRTGPVPIYGTQSLYAVLSAGGGFTATVGSTITITHPGQPDAPEIVHINSLNYQPILETTAVRPGDTVVVSTAEVVWVVGGMNRQGPIPMPNGVPLSLLQLLSTANGPTQSAKTSKAAIIRQKADGSVDTINVDLQRVLRRQDPNIQMQASDILVVPLSGLKAFEQYVLPSLTTTAASVALSAAVTR